jgi:hypothetical protein
VTTRSPGRTTASARREASSSWRIK